MKIVVDYIPKCSSDCVFSRYFSCERRRCILTDNICALDNDIPNECHKLTTTNDEKLKEYIDETIKFKDYITLDDIYEFLKRMRNDMK